MNTKNCPKLITMRHEEKFLCSERQMVLLESRIKTLLSPDANQTGEGYNIRSVYFDTIGDRLLEESAQGVDDRNKFRIRIYNGTDNMIRLEKKSSVGQLKQKHSCKLDRAYVDKILQGNAWPTEILEKNPVLQEFEYLQMDQRLAPSVIVEYDRSAYVSLLGNIRITFDRNIRASKQIQQFFDDSLLTLPILPDGQHVLEVKYDSIFPGYLSKVLNLGNLQRVSFSKYGLCRNIFDHNGRIEDYYEF